jgi:hypothetical protein
LTFGDARIPERVWSKITVDSDGHWIWNGVIAGSPQIRWKVEGTFKTVSVRRVLFEFANGPTTAPAIGGCRCECVNPAHAIAGSSAEITAKWKQSQDSSRCKRGHVLAEVGTYVRIVKGKRVASCRRCWLERQKERNDARYLKRLRRMSPERRASFIRRSAAIRRAWRTGARRCRDGSLSVVAIAAAEAST